MSTLRQDLRFALRTLSKSPVFSAVAVLSLALGIGANTALFSFIDRLLLRSLPVHDPQLLMLLDSTGASMGRVEGAQTFSYRSYKAIRDQNEVFEGVLARADASVSVTWKNATEIAAGELVSGNYFDVLGIRPQLGRFFAPEEDRVAGAGRVAVLSYGYWQRKFGADPSVVGTRLLVNGQPFEVIGVAPQRFEGVLVGQQTEVFVPVTMKAVITPTWDGLEDWRTYFVNIFARLKPGVTQQMAQSRMEAVYARILNQDIDTLPPGLPEEAKQRLLNKKLRVLPGFQGRSFVRGRMEKPLIVLMAMVGLVLLIACANLANLLIARAASRQREIAIRLSLGASRSDLIRQLFTESALIAFAGGALGVLIAVWASDLLAGFTPGLASGPGAPSWSIIDNRVLGFNFAVSVITALLFGLIPAWKSTRPAVASTLKDQAGSVASTSGEVRLRKGLVVAQIALSLLLLFGASLFARSLQNLRNLDPGFATDNLLTFTIDPSLAGYKNERARTTIDLIRRNVASLPGVRSVAVTDYALLAGNQQSITVNIEGYQRKAGESMNPEFAYVGPGYFTSLGTRVLSGRDFDERDAAGGQKVAVINTSFAKKWFPNQNPLGRKIAWGRTTPDHVIVGVVADQKQRTLREESGPAYFYPFLQNDNPGVMAFYIRASGDPTQLANSVRREVTKVSNTIPLFDMRTMAAQLDQALNVERAVATMSGFFGLLAATLAAIGLYGVMAYTVTRRTREIGIRMALGAERTYVLWLVLKEVLVMLAIGVAVGMPFALFLSRYVESQVYGVTPNDVPTLLLAVTAMTLIAVIAGLVPARRAATVDPIRALRYE